MGVNDFLPTVLQAAGNPVDLRTFRDGIDVVDSIIMAVPKGEKKSTKRKRHRRPLRIGVDVSNWIYRATHRFGDMLADERHLTNYGRYQLVNNELQEQQKDKEDDTADDAAAARDLGDDPHADEKARKYIICCTLFVMERLEALQAETNAEVLVVLDGATPPIKMATVQERSQVRKESVRKRDAPVDIAAVSTGGAGSDDLDAMEAQLNERTKANRRAGAGKLFSKIVEELLVALRERSLPFLVAPYEADGQLAYLSRERLIDLIITEDSDLVAQGGRCMVYKMSHAISKARVVTSITETETENSNIQSKQSAKKHKKVTGEKEKQNDKTPNSETPAPKEEKKVTFVPSGILLQKDDLGAVTVSRSGNLSLRDMSDAMLAVMFVAAGSDYGTSLKGIGLVNACEIVNKSFLHNSKKQEQRNQPPLERVFELLFQRTYDRTIQGDMRRQGDYKGCFLAALLMYRHPVVYSPFKQRFITAGAKHGDPELTSYAPYKELLENKKLRAEFVGDLMKGGSIMATGIAEGWVSPRTKQLYESAKHDNKLPKAVKRYFGLEEAVQAIPRNATTGQFGDAAEAGSGEAQFDDPEEDTPMEVSGAESEQLSQDDVENTNFASQDQTEKHKQLAVDKSQSLTRAETIPTEPDVDTTVAVEKLPTQMHMPILPNEEDQEMETQESTQLNSFISQPETQEGKSASQEDSALFQTQQAMQTELREFEVETQDELQATSTSETQENVNKITGGHDMGTQDLTDSTLLQRQEIIAEKAQSSEELEQAQGTSEILKDSGIGDTVLPETQEVIQGKAHALELETQDDSQLSVASMHLETQAPAVNPKDVLADDASADETNNNAPLTNHRGVTLRLDMTDEIGDESDEEGEGALNPLTQPGVIDLSLVDSEDEGLPVLRTSNFQAAVKSGSQ